jgi:hypothetical protein
MSRRIDERALAPLFCSLPGCFGSTKTRMIDGAQANIVTLLSQIKKRKLFSGPELVL